MLVVIPALCLETEWKRRGVYGYACERTPLLLTWRALRMSRSCSNPTAGEPRSFSPTWYSLTTSANEPTSAISTRHATFVPAARRFPGVPGTPDDLTEVGRPGGGSRRQELIREGGFAVPRAQPRVNGYRPVPVRRPAYPRRGRIRGAVPPRGRPCSFGGEISPSEASPGSGPPEGMGLQGVWRVACVTVASTPSATSSSITPTASTRTA